MYNRNLLLASNIATKPVIFLIHNIRKIILLASLTIALLIYIIVYTSINSASLRDIRLAETYALTAITYLYFALLASPLFAVFPNLKFKPIYIRGRRALGQSVFLFAVLHAYFAFFRLLGSFSGLFYLGWNYLLPIIFSATALLILTLMFATSFDTMVKKLGKYWKILHRLVYLAALLIGIHALMLGTNFADLSGLIPKIAYIALAILLTLEALRLDKFLSTRFQKLPNFGFASLVVVGLIVFAGFYITGSSTSTGSGSLGIHSQHILLAQQAQNSSQTQLPNLPGLNGDRTKRYTVSFDHPKVVSPQEQVTLTFSVYDAASGNPISLFSRPYEKFMHLIVVDDTLSFFEHLHPDKDGTKFTITTSFPKEATYHLYTDFQPTGGIDQQIAFTLPVGNPTSAKATEKPDSSLTKTFGDYQVTLKTPSLSAAKMSLGQQTLSFTLINTKTKSPVTTLKPYLGAFGHLVMINESSYDYLHVHPANLTQPNPNENGGPTVDFLPIGIYGPFKAGTYRVFAQFNPNNALFVADFTITVGN